MNATAPSFIGHAAGDGANGVPFDALRYDLQRSQIVCNTLDALFRRSEGLCLPSEASGLRDFVRTDLRRIYEIWSEDVIALIERVRPADREAQSLVATLRGELAPLRETAASLETALDRFCEEPMEAAKQAVAELVTRFCPAHRSLVDWLQAGVLSWLAKRLDAPARLALATAMARRPEEESDETEEPRAE